MRLSFTTNYMEENTENVGIPDTHMSQSENAPVFYGASNGSVGTDAAVLAGLAIKDSYAPALDGATNSAIGCARDQIGDLKGLVKDVGSNIRSDVGDVKFLIKDAESDIRRDIAKAEADIRADILREGQENMAATKDAECHISKEVLENKFAITKEVLETKHSLAKDILKSEYENKLALQAAIKEINANAQHNAERTQDKIDHGFEEVNEKLCECCAEAEVTAAVQNGLLNTIISALNVGGLK